MVDRCAQELPIGRDPSEIEVEIVLPRHPDAAVHLDAVLDDVRGPCAPRRAWPQLTNCAADGDSTATAATAPSTAACDASNSLGKLAESHWRSSVRKDAMSCDISDLGTVRRTGKVVILDNKTGGLTLARIELSAARRAGIGHV